MATLEQQLAKLKAARASGVLRVRFADNREVFYRSLDEINKAIAAVQADIDAAAGTSPLRQLRTTVGRGT